MSKKSQLNKRERAMAYAVKCSACGAQPGTPCAAFTTSEAMRHPHMERVRDGLREASRE